MNINKSPVRTITLFQCYARSSLPLSGNSGTKQGASMIGDLLGVPEYFVLRGGKGHQIDDPGTTPQTNNSCHLNQLYWRSRTSTKHGDLSQAPSPLTVLHLLHISVTDGRPAQRHWFTCTCLSHKPRALIDGMTASLFQKSIRLEWHLEASLSDHLVLGIQAEVCRMQDITTKQEVVCLYE